MSNKDERMSKIVKIVDKKGSIRVTELVELLNISDMTIRRDLIELDKMGLLEKIHGGAKSKNNNILEELSHDEKYIINVEKKLEIAKKAQKLIKDGDVIFLGPGTTIELLAKEIKNETLKIVTNCLPIFEVLVQKKFENKKKYKNFKVFLLGGEMRNPTKVFVGDFANIMLSSMKFDKIFFSANAVNENDIMTSNMKEGLTQKLAIENSSERYLLIDDSKFDKKDFITFYRLEDVTKMITNE